MQTFNTTYNAGDTMCSGLYWLAGAAPEDVRSLPQRTRIQCATLGVVFAFNLLVLLFVWGKVGWHYFGVPGLIVPGVAVPALFVLGLDRLIAMRQRPLTAELAGFNLPQSESFRRDALLRMGMAVALSALTTFTFMLDQAAGPIRHHQDAVATRANQPMREALVDRIQTAFGESQVQLQARQQQLTADRTQTQAQFETALAQMTEVEAQARLARAEATKEAAGLGQRLVGEGIRFRAQQALAAQHEQSTATLAARQNILARQRESLDKEATEMRIATTANVGKRNRDLGNVEEDLRLDPRFVKPVRGIFADAASFLALLHDPGQGAGLITFSILLIGFMFSVECAALLCIALNPSSPLDVLRMAGNRESAAEIVARSELAIAAASARGVSLNVGEPGRPSPANVQRANREEV